MYTHKKNILDVHLNHVTYMHIKAASICSDGKCIQCRSEILAAPELHMFQNVLSALSYLQSHLFKSNKRSNSWHGWLPKGSKFSPTDWLITQWIHSAWRDTLIIQGLLWMAIGVFLFPRVAQILSDMKPNPWFCLFAEMHRNGCAPWIKLCWRRDLDITCQGSVTALK